MSKSVAIVMAQAPSRAGDLTANADAILAARERARSGPADLIIFPEMHLTGYPCADLVNKPVFVERAAAELQRLASATVDGGPALLVGSVFVRDGQLHNGLSLLEGGRVAATRFKHELPDYGPFDEPRHFAAAPLPEPVPFRGVMLGLPIGEDIWHPAVCRHLAEHGAQILLCINGSPYEIDKDVLRIDGVAKRRAVDTGLPLAYLNRVGGQDALVFDGGSFIVNADGTLAAQLPQWERSEILTRWVEGGNGWSCMPQALHRLSEHPEDIYCAMVVGLRDYVEGGGLQHVIVAPGEDAPAALCAAIAADALGPERVHSSAAGAPPALLLSVADKTALAIGDRDLTRGQFAPLHDCYRSALPELMRWRNLRGPQVGRGPLEPPIAHTLIVEPSEAEIARDAILRALIEEDRSVDQIVGDGYSRADVAALEDALYRTEALRRRAPPGVKLGPRSFGADRRYPIVNGFRSG